MTSKGGTEGVAAAPRWVAATCALAICWGAGSTMLPARPHGGASVQAQPARADAGPELRREHFARIDRERWPAEVYLEQIEPDLARLLDGLRHSPFPEKTLRLLLHQDFRGSPFTGEKEAVSEANGLTAIRWRLQPGPLLRRAAFLSGMARYAGTFSAVERTEAHTGLVEILDGTPGTLRVRLQVDARFSGRAQGLAREDQARLVLEYVRAKDAGPWRLRSLALQEMRTLRGSRQFHQATGALPDTEAIPDENLFIAYFAAGVSLADVDGDGDLDVFQARRHEPARLYRNDGSGGFQDATSQLGLAALMDVRSGYFFDWDNDGDLDALILTAQRVHLLENQQGRFIDVSEGSDFHRLRTTGLTGAAVADYDNDGLLDFYVCSYGDPAEGPGFGYFDSSNGFFNKLFRNQGDGRFSDETDRSGLGRDNQRWTYAALWIDHDGDDRVDLYVVNDYGANQLFRNLGDGTFVDVATEAGVADPGNGMGAVWADVDNDGLLDLYVSNMHSYAGARITRAAGFAESAALRATGQRFAKGNTLLRNLGGGRFEEHESSGAVHAGWAWGNLAFDYDNDGDRDLYVANGMFSNASQTDT